MTNPSSSIRPAIVAFSFLFVVLGFSQPVLAGPGAPDDGCLTDPGCRVHYDKAVQFFEAGRFESALPEFQAAYDRRQMPWLLINIGRTLHRLGRPREALDHYERYRQAESRPDAETQERLEKYIAQSKALADTPGVATSGPGTSTPASTPTGGATTDTPIYKKWWFWTILGVATASAVAGVVGATWPSVTSDPSGIPIQKTF